MIYTVEITAIRNLSPPALVILDGGTSLWRPHMPLPQPVVLSKGQLNPAWTLDVADWNEAAARTATVVEGPAAMGAQRRMGQPRCGVHPSCGSCGCCGRPPSRGGRTRRSAATLMARVEGGVAESRTVPDSPGQCGCVPQTWLATGARRVARRAASGNATGGCAGWTCRGGASSQPSSSSQPPAASPHIHVEPLRRIALGIPDGLNVGWRWTHEPPDEDALRQHRILTGQPASGSEAGQRRRDVRGGAAAEADQTASDSASGAVSRCGKRTRLDRGEGCEGGAER